MHDMRAHENDGQSRRAADRRGAADHRHEGEGAAAPVVRASLLEARRLMGKGLGCTDVHLIASAILAEPARLWTTDTRLLTVAKDLGIGHP